jgi:voltage-gated potassium channel
MGVEDRRQQTEADSGLPVDGGQPLSPHSFPAQRTLRRRVYEIVEAAREGDRHSELFDRLLIILILLNVVAFVAETVPSLAKAYGPWFDLFENVSVGLFTVEYVLRIWSAPEIGYLRRLPGWKARLHWATRPYLIIDLISILPFYLHHVFGLDLRIVRLLRVTRLLRLTRYSPAMHTLGRVIYGERRALVAAVYLLAAAVIFAATGIHYLESEAQPEKFGSIPESAWWAIATLTTVGYGDVVPVTMWGKAFGAVVMVTGLCILALPVAIISTGFAQEVGRRDFVINWSLMSRVPVLADLDAFQVAEIIQLFHAHNVPPRTQIIARASPGEAMFFIASGQVQFDCDVLQRTYGTGEYFGLAAMLGDDKHYGSFTTVGRCRLLKLYREDFRRLEYLAPDVARRLRADADKRIRERQELIAARSGGIPADSDLI